MLLLLLVLLPLLMVSGLPGVLVGLLRNARAHVRLKTGRHPSPPSHLKSNTRLKLLGEDVDGS